MEFRKSFDVVVCGGGIAGVAAAVAAARRGAKTALIEKTVFPGGLATTGLVFIYLPICDGNGHQLGFGLTEELLQLSRKYGPSVMHESWQQEQKAPEARRYRTIFEPAAYIMALDELLETSGVDVWYDTVITGVNLNGEVVASVNVCNKSGVGVISGARFVDATGDADLAFYAGAELAEQTNSISFWAREYSKDCRGDFTSGIQMAMLGASDYDLGARGKTPGINGKLVSEAILAGRRQYREKLNAFYAAGGRKDDLYPLVLPSMAQFRRTRRIVGEFTMTDDMLYCGMPKSVGVCGDWRIHTKVWELPYGALIPSKLEHLITAGRCISADGEAWTVTRVIPVAAQTGEVAGVAAALSLEQNCSPRALPYDTLAKTLRETCGLPLTFGEIPGLSVPKA